MKDLMKGSPIDLSEVQDFSMSKKMASANAAAAAAAAAFTQGNKGKLDDMLSKLMKKNNYVSDAHLPAIRTSCSYFEDLLIHFFFILIL